MNDRFELALSLRPAEWRSKGTGLRSINIALLQSEEESNDHFARASFAYRDVILCNSQSQSDGRITSSRQDRRISDIRQLEIGNVFASVT
jgi:hypothetical protein